MCLYCLSKLKEYCISSFTVNQICYYLFSSRGKQFTKFWSTFWKILFTKTNNKQKFFKIQRTQKAAVIVPEQEK